MDKKHVLILVSMVELCKGRASRRPGLENFFQKSSQAGPGRFA